MLVPSTCPLHDYLYAPKLELSIFANACSEFSVTIVSIIRLINLLRGYGDFYTDYTHIFVWTSVEANVSIICGKYMIAFSTRSHNRDNAV